MARRGRPDVAVDGPGMPVGSDDGMITGEATETFKLPSPRHLAACQRMAADPHLLDPYPDESWVAFSGDRIVAAGLVLEDVIREAPAAGEDDPLIVPIMPAPFIGV